MGTVKDHVLKLHSSILPPPPSFHSKGRLLKNQRHSVEPQGTMFQYGKRWYLALFSSFLTSSRMRGETLGVMIRELKVFFSLCYYIWNKQDLKQWSWRLGIISLYIFGTERAWARPRSMKRRNLPLRVELISMLEIKMLNNYRRA